ncbi:MAG TPA: hypothetical protein VIS72_09010 [Anaerolineales bacterium]
MKTKFAQLISFVSSIDRRYLQTAYFALSLFTVLVVQGPSDGGVGPFGR